MPERARANRLRIVLPGGSGQIGTVLAHAFVADGHDVTVLSRNPAPAPWRTVAWDAATLGDWARAIDGADVVVNLAGRSVDCRYTAANRAAILDSRVRSTHVVGEAIAAARARPRLWLQASTATIYSHRFDAPNDERTGVIGGAEADAPASWRFSIEVAKAWEATLAAADVAPTRKVALRTSMVMSPDRGGIFDTLLKLVRRGFGGRAGSGRQYISWIHEQDFVRALYWLIDHEEVTGVVNLTAPEPLPNAAFMRALREAAGVPIGLPATRALLTVGAFFLRTETELILKSRRVAPTRLLEGGFSFVHPTWPEAARELVARSAANHHSRSTRAPTVASPASRSG